MAASGNGEGPRDLLPKPLFFLVAAPRAAAANSMPYPKWHRRDRQERVLFCARSSRMSRTIGALYQFLYAGFLSRLPEPAAIWLGQSVLRRLPLDRLSGFRLADPRLAITLGGVALPN